MQYIYPPIEELKQQTIQLFEQSEKRHLLITGSKSIGKTTLCEALIKGHSVPGLRSYAERSPDGTPSHIFLQERTGSRHCCIGTFSDGAMHPDAHAFDTIGVQLLADTEKNASPWAMVDEIGFLEQSSPNYLAQMEHLFDTRRVIAALRKANTPFLCKLRNRPDCFLLDLDEWQPSL